MLPYKYLCVGSSARSARALVPCGLPWALVGPAPYTLDMYIHTSVLVGATYRDRGISNWIAHKMHRPRPPAATPGASPP